MTNFKRKKKRQRNLGWTSSGRLHKHKRIDEQSERNLHNRKKSKNIVILAKRKPNTPKWFMPDGWFVWSRYEKLKDAQNALKILKSKEYPSEHYEFKLDY